MAVSWAELVAKVRAAPEDRSARQLAIEWLLDRGDPRGECLAMYESLDGVAVASAQWNAIWERLGQFSGTRPWEERVRALGVDEPIFERGWLEHAELSGDAVMKVPALFELEPVRSLCLRDPSRAACAELAGFAGLAHVRRLTLESHEDASFDPLPQSPYLQELEHLALYPFSDRDAYLLFSATARPRAFTVQAHDWRAGALLAESEVMSRVAELTLHGRQCDAVLADFFRGAMGPLRVLHATSPLHRALAGAGAKLNSVESLHLSEVSNDNLLALGALDLQRLTDLRWVRPDFSGAFLQPLRAVLARLERLQLTVPTVDQRTYEVLATSLSPRLKVLGVHRDAANDLSALIRSEALAGVHELSLREVRFDAALIAAINTLAARGTLRQLDLHGCGPELLAQLVVPGVVIKTDEAT